MSGRTSSSTRCITWRCWNRRSAPSTRPPRWPAGTCPKSSPPCAASWRPAWANPASASMSRSCGCWRCSASRMCWPASERHRARGNRLRCREASGAVPDRASAAAPGSDGLPLPAACERGDHLGQSLHGPARRGDVMTEMPQVLLAHHLKALKLATFLREYDKLARQCAAEGVDHPRYLLRLAELELIDRERRMVERRIKEARFPAVKSLDSFVFAPIPSLNQTLLLDLARSEYVIRRENIIALGNSGTGKTHIALGLGLAACQKGLSVGFTTAAGLVHELLEARDEKRLLRLQRQLAGYKLLIIDELG